MLINVNIETDKYVKVKSNQTYHIRVGLILLLCYYVEEEYLDLILKYLDNIKSDEYYVNMGEAWLICEIFIKYESVGLKFLEYNKLNKFTINKSISKIRVWLFSKNVPLFNFVIQ